MKRDLEWLGRNDAFDSGAAFLDARFGLATAEDGNDIDWRAVCLALLDWTGPHCRMRDQLGRDIDGHGFAATPALALTAACLRARATSVSSPSHTGD